MAFFLTWKRGVSQQGIRSANSGCHAGLRHLASWWGRGVIKHTATQISPTRTHPPPPLDGLVAPPLLLFTSTTVGPPLSLLSQPIAPSGSVHLPSARAGGNGPAGALVLGVDLLVEEVLGQQVELAVLLADSVSADELELLQGELVELVLHLPDGRLLQLGRGLPGGRLLLRCPPQMGLLA